MLKSAYEMRISDWSSYVCSADLEIDLAGDGASLDVNIGAEEGLLHIDVERPGTGNRVVDACLKRIADIVLVIDRGHGTARRIFIIEEGVVEARADIGAEALFRHEVILHRQGRRQQADLAEAYAAQCTGADRKGVV